MPALGSTTSPVPVHEAVSPEEEKRIVDEFTAAVSESLKEGDPFYLVSARWWREWCHFVGDEEFQHPKKDGDNLGRLSLSTLRSYKGVRRPPAMDNGELLAGPTTSDPTAEPDLKENLVEDKDYVLVSDSVWKAFHKWYGGGPEIKRLVIKHGQQEELAVEVYPLRLRLKLWDRNEETALRCSKKASVSQLLQKACDVYGLKPEDVRLWDYYGGSRQKVLSDSTQSLEDAELQMNNEILVEVKTTEGWPTKTGKGFVDVVLPDGPVSSSDTTLVIVPASAQAPSRSIAGGALPSKAAQSSGSWAPFTPWTPFSSGSKDSEAGRSWLGGSSSTQSAKEEPVGLTGLSNLGNTCFMNSSLQCLIHTPPIKDFFIGDYSSQINSSNLLGMQGELALAFGDLLRKLWAPGRTPVAPRAFKTKLAKFAPQFSGYNQHDSQELLAFLLDGLHEDLNRVQRKPYIEAKDADGRPDDVVADEYWANHKARNDSIIVDTCQGQYKSTLVCPVCNKVSVTFDPFMYLSLPLPAKSHRSMTITVISTDGARPPETHTLNVPKVGKFRDLQHILGKACGLSPTERLLFGEVYNNKIFRFYLQDNELLTTVNEGDKVVAYRTPANCGQRFIVVQRRRDKLAPSPLDSWKPFSTPLMVCVPNTGTTSGADIYKLLEAALAPFQVSRPDDKAMEVGRDGADMSGENGDVKMEGSVQNGAHAARDNGAGAEVQDGDAAMAYGEVDYVECSKAGEATGTLSGTELPSAGSSRGEATNGNVEERAEMDIEESTDQAELRSSNGGPGCSNAEMDGGCTENGALANGAVPPVVSSDSQMNNPPNEPVKKYPFKLTSPRSRLDGMESTVEMDTSFPGLPVEKYAEPEPRHLSLDWTEEGLQDYRMGLLEKLPEILRTMLQQPVKNKRQDAVSLYSCLEAFLKEEPLGPEDMWYCPGCKEHRQASKKLDLWRLPEILVVHLKRFSYSRFLKNKLDTMVQFPVHDLDLSPYARGECSEQGHFYELYAVSNHYGGMGGGHYTAYSKVNDNQWYNFDDSHVSGTNENDILTSAAYVLFYQRKKQVPLSSKT